MVRRNRSRRIRRPRSYSPRFIVSSEGEKTEYQYLTRLNQQFKRVGGPCLVPVRTNESDPLAVIQRLVDEVENDRQNGNFVTKQGDAAYALLDAEPHDPSKASRIDEAIKEASKHNVRILFSNPSFEFWLICHVVNTDQVCRAFTDPKELDQELRRHSGCSKEGFHKNPNRLGKLIPRASHAVQVARYVHQNHHSGAADVRAANACTEVYELVSLLI